MKKSLSLSSAALAAVVIASGIAAPAFAAEQGASQTQGTVKFVQAQAPGPVNPTDPSDPSAPGGGETTPTDPSTPGVTPVDPSNPDGGIDPGTGLAVTAAPGFNFGIHPVDFTNSNVYYSYAEQYKDTATGNSYAAPSSLQVFDGRGLGANGSWSVSVQQDAQFNDGSSDLTGAQITLNNDNTNSVVTQAGGTAPGADATVVNTATLNLTPGGAAQTVFTSGQASSTNGGSGLGLNVLNFGKAASNGNGSLLPDLSTGAIDSKSAVAQAKGSTALALNNNNTTGYLSPNVVLSVPAGAATTNQYTTTLTWKLYDTPNAE